MILHNYTEENKGAMHKRATLKETPYFLGKIFPRKSSLWAVSRIEEFKNMKPLKQHTFEDIKYQYDNENRYWATETSSYKATSVWAQELEERVENWITHIEERLEMIVLICRRKEWI